jgi:hypothetical protein
LVEQEGTTTRTHYAFNGQVIAQREGSTVLYLHGDHLGSVSVVTSASSAVLSRQEYTPWGAAQANNQWALGMKHRIVSRQARGVGRLQELTIAGHEGKRRQSGREELCIQRERARKLHRVVPLELMLLREMVRQVDHGRYRVDCQIFLRHMAIKEAHQGVPVCDTHAITWIALTPGERRANLDPRNVPNRNTIAAGWVGKRPYPCRSRFRHVAFCKRAGIEEEDHRISHG